MAEVVWTDAFKIEVLLGALQSSWERLPSLIEHPDDWDDIEAETFAAEWPLQKMRQERIEEFIAAGKLTPEQLARYEDIKELMDRNRSYVSRIYGDGRTAA